MHTHTADICICIGSLAVMGVLMHFWVFQVFAWQVLVPKATGFSSSNVVWQVVSHDFLSELEFFGLCW